MKISYKNTALGFLEAPASFKFYLPEYTKKITLAEEENFKYSLRQATITSGFKDAWLNNVQYVTMPFHDAYARSGQKIKAVVQETAFDGAGTLIIPWKTHTQTIFYALDMNGKKDDWKYEAMILLFTKSPHSEEFGLDLFVYFSTYSNDYRDLIWKGFVDSGRDLSWWVAYLMCFNTFLKYAEVETKIVNAKRKENHLGEKYVNETSRNIEILDSTYFTTISRTDGFGVSGHFRFQPYGPGLSLKRLQWIADYEKTGYTRKAKILNK